MSVRCDGVKFLRCLGADGFQSAVGNPVSDDDPGGGPDQPRGGVPDGRGAAAAGHGRHGLLELARPRRAAALAAPRTHIQHQALGYI